MLDSRGLGLAGGVLWGVSLCACTLLSFYTGYGRLFFEMIAGIYPGYSISLIGSLVGAIYGFLDGFVVFFLLAWLYNRFSKPSL